MEEEDDVLFAHGANGPVGHVMVVDDEPAIVEIAAAVLEAADFTVSRCASAADCLARIDDGPVDAVLTDICMDEMDGFDLIRALAERAPSTRVVVMTGHDSYDMVRSAIASGAYDYIDKPLDDHAALIGSITRAVETGGLQRRNMDLVRQLGEANTELETANRRLLELNRRLRLLASTDGLTNLYNRRYADHFITRELARCKRYGDAMTVMLIDVDHFKRFNDTHGHAGGDKALQSVARCLRECARRTDLVARYGGEEFVAVLPATAHATAGRFAERLRLSIASRSMVPQIAPGELTVSVGYASVDGSEIAASSSALIAAADHALYAAKTAGRDRVECAPDGWSDPDELPRVA